jgi:hypothetical protein
MIINCAICGKELSGTYLVDYWGTKFCLDHWDKYPKCCYCGRLVPTYKPGNNRKYTICVRCDVCKASSINQIQQARPIFAQLIKWVNMHGLRYNNLSLRIEFRNRSQLDELAYKLEKNTSLGATIQRTITKYGHIYKTDVDGVAILRGLPITLFKGVTVHELGHAWLIVHKINNLPTWAVEGFCELLSYHYYIYESTHESTYYALGIEKNLHPDYGGGFRLLREMETNLGFINLINYIQNNHQLPGIKKGR